MKMLPYPEAPILICYHNKAFPFGIIQANSPEDITKWLCTKSINCVYNPNSPKNKFDLAIWDTWGNWEGITTHQVISIRKDLIGLFNIDLLSMLKTFINYGCYISGSYNEKYIPGKLAYNIEDYIHDFLVIGYDDTNFYSVGFMADGRFKQFDIPIQNFINSLYSVNSSKIEIAFFNYNKGVIPKPNVDRLISDLEKYISTANYMDNPTPKSNSYGISTLMRIRDFFVDEVVNNKKIYVDKRYSRVLYEHEWVFLQMIDIFMDDDSKKSEYKNYASINLKRAKLVHMLGLKMECTQDESLIKRIKEYIDEIIDSEKIYIPGVIELLKQKYKDATI